MSDQRSPFDPQGYYARLGVAASSEPEVITAAYRRIARVVHPDVPGTGDATAFLALKQAYDVLIHPDRRAAYDRMAKFDMPRTRAAGVAPGFRQWDPVDGGAHEIDPMPFPDIPAAPARHPRLTDLPAPVWAAMAALVVAGTVEVGSRLLFPPKPGAVGTIPALARDVPPPGPSDPPPATFGAAPVRLAGEPNLYVLPSASPVTLWRLDDARHGMVPWGQLPPFSAIQGLRIDKQTGMVEVRVTETANGYVTSGLVTPGTAATAAGAWCTYHAGLAPQNGEILTRAGEGKGRLRLENRSAQPLVVKLRGGDGGVTASIFLTPGGQTTAEGLREDHVRVEYATGEVWSRACHGFTAGMRAQVLAGGLTIGQTSGLTVPPVGGTPPAELPDQAFEREE